MDFGIVAIEREDSFKKCVYGSSGIILERKYVIATGNILTSLLDQSFFDNLHSLEPGKIHSLQESPVLKIIWKNDKIGDRYNVTNGNILGFFTSDNIKRTANQILQGWVVDDRDNSTGKLKDILSLFFIIKIEPNCNITDFKNLLWKWYHLIKEGRIVQLDEILVKSVPFGNRFFYNSCSRGIVSNVLGSNSCLIVSDCPVTPGSEGSPVYKIGCNDIPYGIVISSSCWWRGDWTGLTLVADFRNILQEQLACYQPKIEAQTFSLNNNYLTDCVESSFVQVYCGSQWGTAVVVNIEHGILLTNSHVIDSTNDIRIFWKGYTDTGTVIYKTPDNEVFDLAMIKCSYNFLKSNNLRAINISNKDPVIGEEVYSVGFAIFNKNVKGNPTVSKGFVMHSNESMIKTSCCINSGMSGGGVLNKFGKLIAIIVCNARVMENVYPHFNMAIPYAAIRSTIQEFIKTKDSSVLQQFWVDNPKLTSPWKQLQAKL